MPKLPALESLGGRSVLAGLPWLDALVGLIVVTLVMTLAVLFLIWLERKLVGRIQMRLGPMRTGPYGLLQSLADAIKLLGKEDLRPRGADRWVFEFAPFVAFVPIFLAFLTLPVTEDVFVRNLPLGLFFIIAVTSVNIVAFVMAGWASDNKYALLGGLRAGAQLISYEIPLVLALVAVALVGGTLDLSQLVEQQGRVPYLIWQPLPFVIFLIASMAELHRQPFDMPVGESEVVGGPLVEYSGIRWSMFFLAEYSALLVGAALGATVFLGGWNWPLGETTGWGLQIVWFVTKTMLLIVVMMWLRATLPRLRIDQLMSYCWKVLLPFAFLQLLLNGLVVVYDWPDFAFLFFSLGGLGALVVVTGVAVRRPGYLRSWRAAYVGHT